MIDWFKVRGETWIASTPISIAFAKRYQTPYPFAKLSVSPDRLTVSVLFDSYTFAPQDVVSFEPGVQIPFGSGFRIRHCVSNYPEYIVFRGLADPEQILRCVHATGFYPQGTLYSQRQAPPYRPLFCPARASGEEIKPSWDGTRRGKTACAQYAEVGSPERDCDSSRRCLAQTEFVNDPDAAV